MVPLLLVCFFLAQAAAGYHLVPPGMDSGSVSRHAPEHMSVSMAKSLAHNGKVRATLPDLLPSDH